MLSIAPLKDFLSPTRMEGEDASVPSSRAPARSTAEADTGDAKQGTSWFNEFVKMVEPIETAKELTK